MGKKNDAIVPFLKDKVHFADLLNGSLFNGEQVIAPDELELLDSTSTSILQDKRRKKLAINRYRDIIMKWKNQVTFALLACEVQENVHYAMPVRNMLYDSLSYTKQIDDLWKCHTKEEKCDVSANEFLSHFRKKDVIYPVITVVFYYGDEWDGNLDLHSMFSINEDVWNDKSNRKLLKKYVPNYHINLINPTKMQDLSVFKSDLQLIFSMLKYKNDKEKLFRFTKDNSSYFKSISNRTAYAIGALLDSDRLLDKVLENDEKEDKNMCKAIEDLYNDGVTIGIQQGIQQGIQGTVTALKSLNCSNDAIIEKLVEVYGIDRVEASKLLGVTM